MTRMTTWELDNQNDYQGLDEKIEYLALYDKN
jgi:hypothetical protein